MNDEKKKDKKRMDLGEFNDFLKTHTNLRISRIPIKTLEDFKKISNDYFCGDYGMTLKDMVDNYLIDWKLTVLTDILERVNYLEMKVLEIDAPKESVIRTLGGKTILKVDATSNNTLSGLETDKTNTNTKITQTNKDEARKE